MNAAQRKYLQGRVDSHAVRIRPPDRYSYDEDKAPPHVQEARRVIDEWQEGKRAEASELRRQVSKEVARLKQVVMFDSAEDAIAEVEDFEEKTLADITGSEWDDDDDG